MADNDDRDNFKNEVKTQIKGRELKMRETKLKEGPDGLWWYTPVMSALRRQSQRLATSWELTWTTE